MLRFSGITEAGRARLQNFSIWCLRRHRRRVGMVFQNPDNQLVATIVEEDVAFGPENLGVPPAEIRERVDKALSLVGMKKYARHSPHQLSGGQKQRVAIAGIIACNPDIIIFDESTAMLDPVGRSEVMDTIEKLNREYGTTVILITHYMEEAARADRVVVINDGKKLLDGTPREVFTKTDKLDYSDLESLSKEQLIDEIIKARVEAERAKKGYTVKGDGQEKEFIGLKNLNSK